MGYCGKNKSSAVNLKIKIALHAPSAASLHLSSEFFPFQFHQIQSPNLSSYYKHRQPATWLLSRLCKWGRLPPPPKKKQQQIKLDQFTSAFLLHQHSKACCLTYLQSEGGRVGLHVIITANTGKDLWGESERGILCWHKTANLSHDLQ